MEKKVLYMFMVLVFLTFTCKSKPGSRSTENDSVATTSVNPDSVKTNDDSINTASKLTDTASTITSDKAIAPNTESKSAAANSKAVVKPSEKAIVKKKIPARAIQSRSGTYIDGNGFTIVNGRRFFPMGIYVGKGPKEGAWATSDDNLQRISAAGFNTILAYTYGNRGNAEGYMSRANANGLKVIYSLTDMYNDAGDKFQLKLSKESTVSTFVQNLKDSPNLLAWYINDELGVGEEASVSSMYQTVRGLDAQHIIFQVNNDPGALSLYSRTSDVIGTDPYVVAGNDFTSLKRVTDWTNSAGNVARNQKGVWQVVQMFDKKFQKPNLASHPPTLNEMRNISYQSLIGGAKGLMFYAYHWLYFGYDASGKKIYSEAAFNKRWPDVKRLINEVNGITPIILKNNKVPLISTGSKDVKYQAWSYNNNLYIVFANTEKKVSFINIKVPGGWALSGKYTGVSVSLQGNDLKMNCAPLTSNVLVFTK